MDKNRGKAEISNIRDKIKHALFSSPIFLFTYNKIIKLEMFEESKLVREKKYLKQYLVSEIIILAL